jgi:hypothetical protein
MLLWLRTYVWTFFYEMLIVVLSVLVSLGLIVSARAMLAQQSWLVLILGLLAGLVALMLLWRQANPYLTEPDPALNDPRPFSARLAADITTALVGVGVVLIIVQITGLGEPQIRWSLLTTILGGPFIALGLVTAWERWRTHTLGTDSSTHPEQ